MFKHHHAILYLLCGYLPGIMALQGRNMNFTAGVPLPSERSEQPKIILPGKRDAFETAANGSTILWVIEDTYEGQNFFE